ncbi:MAG: hypothetical protein ACQCN6_14165 [Candidatus Bathyarchaeia archaeon]|jgi:hypothetical protein
MNSDWTELEAIVDTVNCKGEAMQVANVKVLKNRKTGVTIIRPSDLAKAEMKQLADKLSINPRDASTLLMIYAKAGNFNEGDVFYKYHLQKMMFYLWKALEDVYADALPIDSFVAAENGPVPELLNADIERFEGSGLICTKKEKTEFGEVKRITLTHKGESVAKELWCTLPDDYKKAAIKVKERIYPKTPEQVRHMVHRDFPEYRNTYVKNDIE